MDPKGWWRMRRYDENVEVRCVMREELLVRAGGGAPEPAWGAGEPVPDAFVWRGRLYVVRAVLGCWVERRPWWRTVLDAPAGEDGRPRLGPDDLEEPVWRLEASAGRSAQPGIYDLAGRPGGPWRLRRVED